MTSLLESSDWGPESETFCCSEFGASEMALRDTPSVTSLSAISFLLGMTSLVG